MGQQPKTGQAANDDTGLTVVVLGVLSRRQWVRKEDLAGELKLPPRKLRSTLQFLEKEKLVARDRRGGTAYSCPDYAQMYDVVRKRYSSLDTLYLMSMEDDGSCLHCESCDGELAVASDSHARPRRGLELKDTLQRMEVQMKPVTEQLDRVKDSAFPEFGSLQDWEASGRPMYIKSVEVEVEFC
ncbi:PREDICTED: general mRNAion factor IIE [Prunus dulcis]|uniref:PREDICTED: general mRNAion factor IIE n=1 Tax=Prunus dulcis TaxID=3755 RepID=A0A5E4EJR6_PRUDU|nr:PREDICTED: general mRNAion factor IIE [Prunus dulcis]